MGFLLALQYLFPLLISVAAPMLQRQAQRRRARQKVCLLLALADRHWFTDQKQVSDFLFHDDNKVQEDPNARAALPGHQRPNFNLMFSIVATANQRPMQHQPTSSSNFLL